MAKFDTAQGPAMKQEHNFMNDFFSKATHENLDDHWEALWKDGEKLFWDRGQASPPLDDLLRDNKELIGGSPFGAGSKTRKRALVPGCGRGYDVLLLASYGYDAWGLDVSPSAMEASAALARDSAKDYPVRDENIGAGQAKFVLGDFYKNEWFEKAGGEKFDLIWDYTFFCAMPLSLRPQWAARQSEILSPKGSLVCLEFPMFKDPSKGGPPWAVRGGDYVQHLARPGQEVEYDAQGFVVGGEEPKELLPDALVRKAHWKAERTHKSGQGTDHVGVFQHRQS